MARHSNGAAEGRAGKAIFAALAIVFCVAAAPGVQAMGGGGGTAQSATPSCPPGQYYSQRCKECAMHCRSGYVWACGRGCVQQGSMKLDDGELFAEAVSLIRAEHYAEALELLWAIEACDDPKVLNYIGFSTRKLGDLETGIKYYHRALEIDPDYALAREYLGEGYLEKGDLAAAKGELAQIEARCGTGCREYAVLDRAIADYRAGRAPAKRSW